jgi:hypothetical protein
MYDEVERSANTGGNLAFFSANVIWWQVRFGNDWWTIVCHKDAAFGTFNGLTTNR